MRSHTSLTECQAHYRRSTTMCYHMHYDLSSVVPLASRIARPPHLPQHQATFNQFPKVLSSLSSRLSQISFSAWNASCLLSLTTPILQLISLRLGLRLEVTLPPPQGGLGVSTAAANAYLYHSTFHSVIDYLCICILCKPLRARTVFYSELYLKC